jgi:V/A-type H+-transporting ATPase subunit E
MSERNLDQLIASLKTEGIAAAEKESAKILEKAKLQAQQIVKAAEEKRSSMLAEAEQEAEALIKKGEAAFRQAGRDYSISVRNELLQMFQAVLEAETRQEFKPDLVKSAIVKVIENIGSEVELNLSPEFSQELSSYIHSQLKSSDTPVKVVENNTILKGFSIAQKDQGWTYTITAEEVAAALQNYLNPNWVKILQKAS